ncbi:ABC transporter substrate-binding protein [Candidatus Marsarchaeota G2 archaeon ECH_B_SAG-F08]|jgi:iron complex transport system substrate-binding protein|uniref:ABC transporter substrate-binding protein n=5 Tax=Candidatus Marsarchaeota TaxID=1978152 RepID=A0A2R6AFC2_9ARCH|nr:MAG: ABC transporter substrate-binding protein [Candidatus Marsarchaeota G1 archaeon OSP_D]PSN85039.1 MAG: ABC transporter substrate-binding protein [Candidatus Marsarchaeota G1 archaeon BE_D]PSN87682.1 MAG: ABC transporter substrate-binding protein [Candidatus Marsarchaeota G1 archaeon OSP_C]PSN97702.1 MAG: ABC transporter substrate-binding protein [Candidatus Marsarchaeota G2 archaeon ECH_B_SAG-F08]PSO05902.1 MAG: ABC transporter substrate-binding protein [Candidatus Marsarchaeota G2 archa
MNRTILAVVLLVVVLVIGLAVTVIQTRRGVSGSTPTSYYPITLKDASGQNVTIHSEPQRIVSLAPSDTQFLIALGLGKQIVGVDYYSYLLLKYLNATSDLPQNVTIVNTYPSPNISGLVALHPSVVIDEIGLIGNYASDLSQAGLTTFYTNADYAQNYTAVESYILTLGKLFDRNKEAQQVVNWMNQKIQSFETSGDTSVAYLLWINPDHTFYTAGSGNFINAIIQLAGGSNVFSNTSGYPVLSPSRLILANPQVIIAQELTNFSYTNYMINTMPGITSVSAYQQNRVYIMSENLPTFLLDEPGPLSVYAIQMIKLMIEGKAPHYVSSEWVESTLNVTLPVF